MKIFVVRSALSAALLLSGNMIAGAMPASPSVDGGVVLAADTNDFAGTRDEYMRKAQDEFQSWQDHMSQWTDAAKDKGSQASAEAQRNLDKAWIEVKAKWRNLQAAAPQAWEKARASYEDASARMKSAWEKIEPKS